MTRLAVVFVASLVVLIVAAPASAQSIYRWRDTQGVLHFSNRAARAPKHAAAIELAPLGSITGPAGAKRASTRTGRAPRAFTGHPSPCGPADPTGLIDAVLSSVENENREEGLTLVASGIPVSVSRDADVRTLVTDWDPDAPQAHLSQSAIAYPSGSSCPSSPPLVRYSTTQGREVRSRGLCDDYRRAFAQVGVAASRDAGIAGSFRDIARDFVRVREAGNVATASGFRAVVAAGMFTSDAATLAPYMTVPLDPWIVAAHASQTAALAVESDTLVEELTVALEEIDRAARARGCWQ